MREHATPEGTRRYAGRFAGRAAPEYFCEADPAGGLVMSSIGIGTYLGDPDARTDTAYTEAVVAAVRGGINVIDSAINYRFQRSERSIGAALRQLESEGFQRDELVICTKAGYLTPDGDMPADPGVYFRDEYLARGIVAPEDVAGGSHCMTPRYLEDQLARSLRNLGVDCVDVFYLHNPETQLSVVSRGDFAARVRAAFAFLESMVAAGKIRFYG
ncbi:MAG TPA: aldo/keto reductase, partial [Candidatus Acidoferrales bacterium]